MSAAAPLRPRPVALDLPGPARRITVEPLRPRQPSPPPERLPEPHPEPAPEPEPRPRRPRKEPAPA